MYSPRWFCEARVGLTEEEDKYLEKLQDDMGFRYRHQVLRYILTKHLEESRAGSARGRSPKRARRRKARKR